MANELGGFALVAEVSSVPDSTGTTAFIQQFYVTPAITAPNSPLTFFATVQNATHIKITGPNYDSGLVPLTGAVASVVNVDGVVINTTFTLTVMTSGNTPLLVQGNQVQAQVQVKL